jgi:uncharacterized protein HemY
MRGLARAMAKDLLAAAHEALRTGAWAEARERFEAAVAAAPSGEAWEGSAGQAGGLPTRS